ncbi:MAG: hypothetical protein V1726_04405 [Methanobacteriota archaeon]
MNKKHGLSLMIISLFMIATLIPLGLSQADPHPSVTQIDRLSTILWRDNASINSIAVGDFDNSHPGSELVCGGESGRVTMVKGRGNNWTATTLMETAGVVQFLDVGDIDPNHPGNEVVVATLDDHLPLAGDSPDPPEYWGIRILEGYGNEWTSTLVYKTENPYGKIWGMRVGDFNTSNPGEEIIACWEFWMDIANVYVYSYNGDTWTDTLIYSGNMVIMDADVGNCNASHPGDEIIMLDEDGDYIQLIQNDTIWEPTLIWEAPEDYAGREVEIGDVDRYHPGDEVVIRTRFVPGILLLEEQNSLWTSRWLLNSSILFTDMTISDSNRFHPGKEIAVVSDRNVTLIWGEGPQWYHRLLWRDTLPLNCVAGGDFDSSITGEELAVSGESRNISRIIRLFPAFVTVIDTV